MDAAFPTPISLPFLPERIQPHAEAIGNKAYADAVSAIRKEAALVDDNVVHFVVEGEGRFRNFFNSRPFRPYRDLMGDPAAALLVCAVILVFGMAGLVHHLFTPAGQAFIGENPVSAPVATLVFAAFPVFVGVAGTLLIRENVRSLRRNGFTTDFGYGIEANASRVWGLGGKAVYVSEVSGSGEGVKARAVRYDAIVPLRMGDDGEIAIVDRVGNVVSRLQSPRCGGLRLSGIVAHVDGNVRASGRSVP